MRDTLCRALVLLFLASIAACGQAPQPDSQGLKRDVRSQSTSSPAAAVEEPKPARSDLDQDDSAESGGQAGSLLDALGLGRGHPVPKGLIPAGDCPPAPPDADEEMAAQAEARVPLKVGLTLTNLWKPNPEEEYECLTQVTAVHRDSIDATLDCNNPRTRRSFKRRLCRADLDEAHMLMTETGLLTVIDASGEEVPETIVGATWFSLSQRQFAELKRTGSVRHRYVQLNASADRVDIEVTSVLRREGVDIARVVVNDRVAEIPVIRASGEIPVIRASDGIAVIRDSGGNPASRASGVIPGSRASGEASQRVEKGHVTALIMDDERFPFLVDYMHSAESSAQPFFRLNYATISFPDAGGRGEGSGGGAGKGAGGGEMERRLAEEKRVDVYGIYFDFNSDRIRRESEPILEEIAGVLERNPDWTLSIDGHTDNVGGDAYNVDLSRRRSESVRRALVERHGIAATRLATAGHGAFAPRDTNETPEGRARNRRVELVRQ